MCGLLNKNTIVKSFLNIVLVGPMGAGKTSTGKALAREIGWEFYDSDQVVEKRAGVDLLWIYDLEGEAGFQKREHAVISELAKMPNIVLATGGGTLATCENRKILSSNSLIVYLSTSLEEQLIRTGYNNKRPLSSKVEERRVALSTLQEKHVPYYEGLADIVYTSDSKTTKGSVTKLVELIAEKNIFKLS